MRVCLARILMGVIKHTTTAQAPNVSSISLMHEPPQCVHL